MKKCLFLLICLVTTAFGTQALEASTLHAIVVCDTTENDIGLSARRDCERMETELEKVAYYSGMQLKSIQLQGRNAVPQRVWENIRKLRIGKEDAVIFYFSGHGIHRFSEKGSRWPELYFSLVDKTISLIDVQREINRKQPRFALFLADSCNNLVEDWEMPPIALRKAVAYSPYASVMQANKTEAYRKLFSKARGWIIAVGAIEGEYAYSTSDGGYFTHTFFDTLSEKALSGSEIEWEELILSIRAELIEKRGMVPDYQVELEK